MLQTVDTVAATQCVLRPYRQLWAAMSELCGSQPSACLPTATQLPPPSSNSAARRGGDRKGLGPNSGGSSVRVAVHSPSPGAVLTGGEGAVSPGKAEEAVAAQSSGGELHELRAASPRGRGEARAGRPVGREARWAGPAEPVRCSNVLGGKLRAARGDGGLGRAGGRARGTPRRTR